MATLQVQTVDLDGLTPSFAAASAGGDKFPADPDGRTFLAIKNGGASPITATIATPGKTGGLDIAEQAVTVAAGGEVWVKPARADLIRGADGLADISWSATASVTVAAVRA